MKKLDEIKLSYADNKISKASFIEEMHSVHERLFEYSKYLKKTDISKIEILDDLVIMTTRELDVKMICDEIDQRIAPIEILNFNNYEEEDFDLVVKLIKDGFTIFDVGANFGWYSINIAKKFPNCKVFSFEPILKTFNYLIDNIKLNNLTNINPYNFGFSDKEAEIKFYYSPQGSGNASSKNLSNSSDVIEVKSMVKKMDDFKEENQNSLDFIKCDVEGAELLVFKGGITLIKKFKPIIFTEMLRKWSAKFDYHPNEIIDLLSGVGYQCFVSNGKFLKKFTKVDENTQETNFFFLHIEKHSNEIEDFLKI